MTLWDGCRMVEHSFQASATGKPVDDLDFFFSVFFFKPRISSQRSQQVFIFCKVVEICTCCGHLSSDRPAYDAQFRLAFVTVIGFADTYGFFRDHYCLWSPRLFYIFEFGGVNTLAEAAGNH